MLKQNTFLLNAKPMAFFAGGFSTVSGPAAMLDWHTSNATLIIMSFILALAVYFAGTAQIK